MMEVNYDNYGRPLIALPILELVSNLDGFGKMLLALKQSMEL